MCAICIESPGAGPCQQQSEVFLATVDEINSAFSGNPTESEQFNHSRTDSSVEPSPETALTDSAAIREAMSKEGIDVGSMDSAIKSVGSISEHLAAVNRGEKPNRCPYLESLGEAGLRLATKMQEAAKHPTEGKTVAERLAEKRQEVAKAAEKPTIIEQKNIKEVPVQQQALETQKPAASMEPVGPHEPIDLLYEDAGLITGENTQEVHEILDDEEPENTPKAIENTKLVDQEDSHANFVEKTAVQYDPVHEPVVHTEDRPAMVDKKKLASPTNEIIVTPQVIQQASETDPIPPVDEVEAQDILQNPERAIQVTEPEDQAIEFSEQTVSQLVEVDNLDFSEELAGDFLTEASLDVPETSPVLSEQASSDKISVQEPTNQITETYSNDQNTQLDLVEQAVESVFIGQTLENDGEALVFGKTELQPQVAQEVKEILGSITDVMNTLQETATIEEVAQAIEAHCMQLCKSLEIDPKHVEFRALAKKLLATLAEFSQTEMSIDERNARGTSEFRFHVSTSITSHLHSVLNNRQRLSSQLSSYIMRMTYA